MPPPGRLLSYRVFFFGLLEEHEDPLLVADDDVWAPVAVDVSGDDLRPHARVVVDKMGDELHATVITHRLEPIEDGRLVPAGLLPWCDQYRLPVMKSWTPSPSTSASVRACSSENATP